MVAVSPSMTSHVAVGCIRLFFTRAISPALADPGSKTLIDASQPLFQITWLSTLAQAHAAKSGCTAEANAPRLDWRPYRFSCSSDDMARDGANNTNQTKKTNQTKWAG